MDGVEAAGEMIGGGLLGRAVEPVPDGQGGEKKPGPGDCLNCATPLDGANYCPNCGQSARPHRTLGGLVHDIVHGVLHLDGKFWRTIPALILEPGTLTRRYINGQRARYISPIGIYLFTVVAMFALVVSTPEVQPSSFEPQIELSKDNATEQRNVVTGLESSIADLREEPWPGSTAVVSNLERELELARDRLDKLEAGQSAEEIDAAPTATDTGADGYLDIGETPWEDLNAAFARANENPSLYLYKAQTTAYKLSWLLIPLSLPFMWLLFPFSKKFRLYDHAVFVTYSIAFMMLLVLFVATLVRISGTNDGLLLAGLVPPIHMYRQLRGTYGLSRRNAIFRAFLMSLFAFFVLVIFIVTMLLAGL